MLKIDGWVWLVVEWCDAHTDFEHLEIDGVYSTVGAASAACRTDQYLMMPQKLDTCSPPESVDGYGFFPKNKDSEYNTEALQLFTKYVNKNPNLYTQDPQDKFLEIMKLANQNGVSNG